MSTAPSGRSASQAALGPSGPGVVGKYSSEPEYLGQELADALASDARVGELGLEISVGEAGIFASGAVTTEQRRQAVGDVLAELVAGAEVHNLVTVVTKAPPSVEQVQ